MHRARLRVGVPVRPPEVAVDQDEHDRLAADVRGGGARDAPAQHVDRQPVRVALEPRLEEP